MIEEVEYSGIWYVPGHQEHPLPGKLHFSPVDGPFVELAAPLEPEAQWISFNTDIVLGEAPTPISLYQCVETKKFESWARGGRPILRVIVRPLFVFIGAHFETSSAICFDRAYLRYSDLNEWVNTSGLDIHHGTRTATINYCRPDQITLAKTIHQEISVDFSVVFPRLSFVQTEATLQQDAQIVIASQEQRPFIEFLNTARLIQDFLTLAVGRPVYPQKIHARAKAPEVPADGAPGGDRYVDVLYQLPELPPQRGLRIPPEMRFALPNVRGRIQSLVENWISSAEELQPVHDLHFAPLYNQRIYQEHAFLNAFQALDTYYSRRKDAHEIPSAEYRALVKQIVCAVRASAGSQTARWLSAKLADRNYKPQKKMLADLLDGFPMIVSTILGRNESPINERQGFIDFAVGTRNWLTHHTGSRYVADHQQTSIITGELRALMDAYLLGELGFTEQENQCYHLLGGATRARTT